jgi:alpha-beta hydrolase superfamily lysophospholipase
VSALDDLIAFLAARDDREREVADFMRSYVLPGTRRDVVVLLHGLTASPPAWRGVADALHAQGATVVVPRLPLHGHRNRMTTVLRALSADLLDIDMRELIAAIRPLGGRLTLAGHSLGGTLAVHAGATIPGIDRIVPVAPFLGITRVPQELHPPFLRVMRALPNVMMWWDPIKRERQVPLHGYPRYPLHALAAGISLADAVYGEADDLPGVRAIDIVLNTRESSVSNRAARRLAKRWRAAGASVAVHQLHGLPRSHDIIEPERPHFARIRNVLVDLFASEHEPADRIHEV